MNKVLEMKCDLIEQNYKVCRKSAKLTMSQAVSLAALLFTSKNILAKEEDIRVCRELLKQKTGVFNNLRGLTNIALLAKMSYADDAEVYIENVMKAYNLIKGKVIRSEYMTLGAQAIAETVEPERYAEMADKTHDIWNKMQKKHFLLTDFADFAMASIFAAADVDIDKQLEEAETCFQLLKKTGFKFNKDALQSISHILAMSDKPVDEKCMRFVQIRDGLKAAKHPIRWEQLPIIATFSGVDIPVDTIVEEICDADDCLKHKKGFGAMACGRQLRRLYACALVLQTHEIEIQENASKKASQIAQTTVHHIITVIINIIIITTIIAAANASSNSSSN